MKGLVCKHLEFIPASQFEEWDGDPRAILIYTSRINGRNYKKKRELVGAVTAFTDRKKGEHWRLSQVDMHLVADTVLIIAGFLHGMDIGRIKFNQEKKELESNDIIR